MRTGIFNVIIAIFIGFGGSAAAQQSVWVQIEAHPTLSEAQSRARNFSGLLENVSGYSLRSGWYAIALGPFTPLDATDVLRQLRVTRQIPGDSYIVDGAGFANQFWPAGIGVQSAAPVSPANDVEKIVVAPVTPTTETVAEARRSEAQLSSDDRKLLQTALKWDGFYSGAIDGAIGRGTRNSMANWQARNNYVTTGVLTTKQRTDLVGVYLDVLDEIGMAPTFDAKAGIEIDLPLAMVELDRYEPPFAHFRPRGDSGVQVLLISQTGDEATLRGLFDIMQTLDIVPLQGSREIGRKSFRLSGTDGDITSFTYAALKDGQVKGFTVVWPAGIDRRRDLVIDAMRASFRPYADVVLPDVLGDPNAAQSVDLLAGLTIRKAEMSRSGFYVDSAGSVLTTSEAVDSCGRITLDDSYAASLVASDAASGLALLRPLDALEPIAIAQFLPSIPRLNSEIAVSGYSYEGLLGAPTLTYGKLADLSGLNGEATLKRLALNVTPGDAGGPVFDANGAVMGMLLPDTQGGARKLPEGVNFAADTVAIVEFLSANGISAAASNLTAMIAPEDLTIQAADMTVLVSCWN